MAVNGRSPSAWKKNSKYAPIKKTPKNTESKVQILMGSRQRTVMEPQQTKRRNHYRGIRITTLPAHLQQDIYST
ncbi:expressed protein [Echinococcus multilocularis]|uniref:Expressed protein n=1 Tax=Echinococcus multilocularis TaxID=6211 RepID=A0A068Y1Q8_ECHMU|nr:expressed protein [Echinococcus multilocularis]